MYWTLLLILLAVGLGVFVWRNNIRSVKEFGDAVKESPVGRMFRPDENASAPSVEDLVGTGGHAGRGRRRHRYY